MNHKSVTDRVREIVCQTFGCTVSAITAQTQASDVEAWDSLGHLRLMIELEREFGIRFSTQEITSSPSVGRLCEILSSKIHA